MTTRMRLILLLSIVLMQLAECRRLSALRQAARPAPRADFDAWELQMRLSA